MQSRRFILQALDPQYGRPAVETMFVRPGLAAAGVPVGYRSNT
jgi:hypothetical protein